ncbi:DUF1566 domain-containing protein [Thiosulfativibrio zosterae]|uniref:Lcl C-terminal domain-containing protein n=1 Tax=Thiosulfativibrio zosterae TaxID=2675053 RepID=A0A6F8PR72_9GAMM|nr:DUF1566 domain-containing protein [Thiosulfativibrio zosterae]BBP44534.1 hypothetical protein THMIRHAT_22800 [Thiosulfativibrio zosterae]
MESITTNRQQFTLKQTTAARFLAIQVSILKMPLLALMLAVTSFTATAETGIVRIATDPTNAKIYINGQRQPNSPEVVGQYTDLELPKGEYKIEAIKEETDYVYKGSKNDVFVSPNSRQPLLIKLTPTLTEAGKKRQADEQAAAKAAKQAAAERKKAAEGKGVVVKGKLMWMRCAMGQTWTGSTCSGKESEYTWQQAKALRHSFAGYSDWRLPTREELLSIRYCSTGVVKKTSSDGEPDSYCADGSQEPTINTRDFPNTPKRRFWSSSAYADGTYGAWFVNFDFGGDYWFNKNDGLAVRLVRSQ